MRINFFTSATLMLFIACCVTISLCANHIFSKDKIAHFKTESCPLAGQAIVTKTDDIIKIMDETADFLKKIKKHPSKFVNVTSGLFEDFGVTVEDVLETVEFIAKTGKKNPNLLQSPWFLNQHFTFYRWHGDAGQKLNPICRGWEKPPEAILTTQYRIIEVQASHKKTERFFYPLYSCPEDEKHLVRKEKLAKKDQLLRFQHSRSEIIKGAFDSCKLVKLIAWLDDVGRKDFAMQGSIQLIFDDGKKHLIQVAGDNNMKGGQQYWFADYVQPVTKTKFPTKVRPMADVTYAGDMDLLGFGKVILLLCWNPQKERQEIRLGVLVDTGSAFKNNLAKLDMFTGYFPNQNVFQQHIKSYPHTARAYILIKKK